MKEKVIVYCKVSCYPLYLIKGESYYRSNKMDQAGYFTIYDISGKYITCLTLIRHNEILEDFFLRRKRIIDSLITLFNI